MTCKLYAFGLMMSVKLFFRTPTRKKLKDCMIFVCVISAPLSDKKHREVCVYTEGKKCKIAFFVY